MVAKQDTRETDTATAPQDKAEQAAAPAKEAKEAKKVDFGASLSTADPIRLGKRYEIDPSQPISDISNEQGTFYYARSLESGKSTMVALVSRSPSGGRTDILTQLRSIEHKGLIRLLDAGIVTFTPDSRQRFIMIYERPHGRRLFNNLTGETEPMGDEEIMRSVIAPVASSISELSQRAVYHGAVRPTNIYAGTAGKTGAILGDCAATLPGLTQPVLFETIERGMADPEGRGPGGVEEDLYALGVTIVMLALGRNPLAGLSDSEVIRQKQDKGSYTAIIGSNRIPGILIEPLRAMLSDDPRSRWTTDDVSLWLSGRRLTPSQAQIPKRSQRPITFAGTDYWRPEALASSMARETVEAVKLIDSGELDRWLLRSVNEKDMADKVREGIESAASIGRNASYEDRVVARVCIALQPRAPMRIMRQACMPKGFGNMLGHALSINRDVNPLVEILKSQLALFWFNAQEHFKPEYMPMIQQFDASRGQLMRQQTGFGLERVAYDLCPTLPCLSPMFINHVVLSSSDVLLALEQIAAHADRPRCPMDRHVAAFLAVRDKKITDVQIKPLSQDPTNLDYQLASLTIFAAMQARANIGPLRHLANWFATLLEPAVEQYRNREHQEKVRSTLKDACERGHLAELAAIVTNKSFLRKDKEQFKNARVNYAKLNGEAKRLRRQLEKRKSLENSSGREMAAILSGMLSMVIVAAILLFQMSTTL